MNSMSALVMQTRYTKGTFHNSAQQPTRSGDDYGHKAGPSRYKQAKIWVAAGDRLRP
jgi:hypothetical protein